MKKKSSLPIQQPSSLQQSASSGPSSQQFTLQIVNNRLSAPLTAGPGSGSPLLRPTQKVLFQKMEEYPQLDQNSRKVNKINKQIEQEQKMGKRESEEEQIQMQLTIKQQEQKYNQISNSGDKLDPKLLTKQSKQSNKSNKSGTKTNSMLLHIEDSQLIPTVFLQPASKNQKCVEIKIPMYRTTTFLRMETQTFILDVCKPGPTRDYQIQRRYSDFVQLYEAIFYNLLGYILPPFPQKSPETWVKVKFGGAAGEREEIIQKRMMELQRFINYLTHHNELCNSEQVVNFITQDQQVYDQGKKRLQKYVQQNKQIQKNSQIKSIIGYGKTLLSYFKPTQGIQPTKTMTINKNDLQFTIILQSLRSEKQKMIQSLDQFQKLHESQRQFSEFTDLSTENDLLLKLCAKHSSGKQFSHTFATFLQVKIIEEYQYNIRRLQQMQKILEYRVGIAQALQNARKQGNNNKKQKITRRLEMLQRNFLSEWEQVFSSIVGANRNLYQIFLDEWQNYKLNMRKIWKIDKKKIK